MAQVIWAEPALQDLDRLAEVIALDKPEAAARLVRRVFSHVEMLVSQPELGPSVPELRPGSSYRQVVEPPCRVFYRYNKTAEKVFILGVMRGEKLFQRRLLFARDRRK